MGGCCVPNCSSHSRKGFRMFTFPRDPKRRKLWTLSCGRPDWEPTNNSQLCEVHFEESQFENNRQDGKRPLKPNAVPTLFSASTSKETVPEQRTKYSRAAKCPKTKVNEVYSCPSPKPSKRQSSRKVSARSKNPEQKQRELPSKQTNKEVSQEIVHSDKTETCANDKSQTETGHSVEISKLKAENEALKRKLWNLQKASHLCTNKLKTMEQKLTFLTSKQLEYLTGRIGSEMWDKGTIKKALQIRYVVGVKGYKFLRRQGFPLPPFRALYHNIHFK